MWVTSRRFLLVMELINSCRNCIERGANMQAHARIIMMIMMPEAMLGAISATFTMSEIAGSHIAGYDSQKLRSETIKLTDATHSMIDRYRQSDRSI